MGPDESKPVLLTWSPLWQFAALLPWLLLIPAFLLRPNRRAEAFTVLIPLLFTCFVSTGLARALGAATGGGMGHVESTIGLLALGLTLLLLTAFAVVGREPRPILGWAAGVLFGVGFLGGLSIYEEGSQVRLYLLSFSVLSGVLVAAMAAARYRCSRAFSPLRFCAWALLSSVVVAGVGIPLIAAVVGVTMMGVGFGEVGMMLVAAFLPALGMGGLLFLVLLPFLLFAFSNAFFRERFLGVMQFSAPPPPARV